MSTPALSPVRPYQPLRLTPESAALARVLARRLPPMRAGGIEVGLAPPPDDVVEPVSLTAAFADAESEDAILTLPLALHDAVLAGLDPAAPGAGPDEAALLLELALEPVLLRLEAAMPGFAFALRPAPASTTAPRDGVSLGVACRVGTAGGVARLDLGPAAARAAARALGRVPGQRVPLPALPIPLHVRALAAELSVAELRELRPGDVVLADTPGDAGAVLVVAGERLAWRARRDGRMVRLASARRSPRAAGLREWTMDDATGPAEDASLAELPVRLVFELGRIEVPLAELETLGPGHVFGLGRGEAEAVDVVANGRRIGRGRVVEVGGAIGVQVAWIGQAG